MIDRDRLHNIAAWSRNLEPEALERVLAAVTERRYPAGGLVCETGHRFDHWMGVADGLLKMRAISREGKEVTLSGVHSGGWFGEGTILKNELRRYDIVAIRPSNLAMVDRATFMWLFENSGAFARFLVVQMNERLGHFIGLLENDRMLDATGRVARAVAIMFNPVLYPDSGQHLDLTQEELGLLAGVSRPTANQAIRQLQEQGLLRTEYGGITILNLNGLKTYGAE